MREVFQNLAYCFCSIWGLVPVIFFFLALSVYAEINEDDREAALKLIVMLEAQFDAAGNEKSLGGGIIFGRDDTHVYIATANHVVRRGEEKVQDLFVTLKSYPDKSLPGVLLKDFDTKLDLAVVRVDGLEKKSIDVCSLELNRLGESKELKRGSSVYAVGHPNGVSWFLPSTSDPVAQVRRSFRTCRVSFFSFLGMGSPNLWLRKAY